MSAATQPVLSVAEPISYAGPLLDNQATTVSIFATIQLRQQASFLPGIHQTINEAFGAVKTARTDVVTRNEPRLATVDEFFAQLREEQDTFIIVLHRPGNANDVLGTASCRRYTGPLEGGGVESPFLRTETPPPNEVWWELKLMAVESKWQRKGVAGFMMRTVEDEIVRRFRLQRDGAGQVGSNAPQGLKIVLSTIKEFQGNFYKNKAFEEDYERVRGDGMSFHIVFMSKTLQP